MLAMIQTQYMYVFLSPQRRVLACLRALDSTSVYHFNLIDKLREAFVGKNQEEVEKTKAFVRLMHVYTYCN